MDDRIKQQLLAIIADELNIDVEIDQTRYPKPEWAVEQIVRSSGLIENICEHGIGHPSPEYLDIHDPTGELCLGIHSCDGCCTPGMREAIKKAYEERDTRTNTPSIESGRCDKT